MEIEQNSHAVAGRFDRFVRLGEKRMITGGFGVTFDLRTGTQRRWVIGRDGVKRWSDNDMPVNNTVAKKELRTRPCDSDAQDEKHG